MNSQSNSFQNSLNKKDDSDITNIDNSALFLFLQFYFSDAKKNLKKILSENAIKNEAEIPKITSSYNFWLNFALNFKDNSFVELMLNKDERAVFCKNSLKEILGDIAKFLFDNLKSEDAFNKIMKNNYNRLYELILRLKEIIDNVYDSALRNDIFINVNEEEKIDDMREEMDDINSKNNVPNALIVPTLVDSNIENTKQFNENNNDTISNVNNVINSNNININNIHIINNQENNQKNMINLPQSNQNEMINMKEEKDKNPNEELKNEDKENNNININNIQENESNQKNGNKEPYDFNYDFPCLDYKEIDKLFHNFCYFTKFNLFYFQVVFYEKVGYAFLDYNGDFLWADEYTKSILFEEDNIKKLNLFNIMTDFSKYILKKKYKDNFFDFRDENNRIRVFTYTIDGGKIKEKEAIKRQEKLYEELRKLKTLVSRATPVLLTGQEGSFITCIFLETKFSFYRQNFDYFYWKSDWNNQ